ncbi:hypothetical protein WJ42_05975 [Burkholderia cepacia]|nr:hypothetical protein WJ42_05975 [Burkholderia cepacia]KWC66895.1 hypothetical protein WL55_19090 [Burkholderia cepacia]
MLGVLISRHVLGTESACGFRLLLSFDGKESMMKKSAEWQTVVSTSMNENLSIDILNMLRDSLRFFTSSLVRA